MPGEMELFDTPPAEITLPPDRCPNCSHTWHGLACKLRGVYSAPNGVCTCPSSLPTEPDLILPSGV